MSSALTGFKVIDLTRVLGGPYCTQILGEHGAEILKEAGFTSDEIAALAAGGILLKERKRLA